MGEWEILKLFAAAAVPIKAAVHSTTEHSGSPLYDHALAFPLALIHGKSTAVQTPLLI